MYLFKDDQVFRKNAFQTFTNCIRIHHIHAVRADDYVKKQHVFRLMTATYGESLFQTRCDEI